MSKPGIFEQAKTCAAARIESALNALIAQGVLPAAPLPAIAIEVPGDRANGDLSCNVAMAGAKAFRMAPRRIADALVGAVDLTDTPFTRFEAAGPGFLNFTFSDDYYADAVQEVLQQGEAFGESDFGGGKKVLLEFVSANPTGPAHMGNARGGALGDCLASVMQTAGFAVKREFYVNDAGNQIAKLGVSLEARYLQQLPGGEGVEMPEDSYHGDDVTEYAAAYIRQYGDTLRDCDSKTRREKLVAFALPQNVQRLRDNMEKYRITYDRWFFESELYKSGAVERVIDFLRKSGKTYERDGALWFMTGDAPDYPDDDKDGDDMLSDAAERGSHNDFVLVRANGFPTYIVPDVAYHLDKLQTRGFDKAINVWGSDHHGYMPRLKQVLSVFGVDPDRLDIIFIQMVKLTRGGEVIKMSKRTGKAITLADLLDEIPTDAVRFLFNMRTPNSQMEFDLDLALEQTPQNPVYYTQYAHARICSIIKNLEAEGIKTRPATHAELTRLDGVDERALIDLLSTLPTVNATAAAAYDPSQVTRYAVTLATAFHKFYTSCRVNCGDEGLCMARLSLCLATRTALRNILRMLKITAPETM